MAQARRTYSRGSAALAPRGNAANLTRGSAALAPRPRPNQRSLSDRLPDVEFKKFEGKTQYEKPDARQGLMNALKAAIVIAVIIAAAALFRVWMTTEIVQSQTQINTVKSQIADVRAYGSELEIQYNSMTDPAKLEKVARDKLKMESPKEVNHIELR